MIRQKVIQVTKSDQMLSRWINLSTSSERAAPFTNRYTPIEHLSRMEKKKRSFEMSGTVKIKSCKCTGTATKDFHEWFSACLYVCHKYESVNSTTNASICFSLKSILIFG